jgi:hypothetical protein
MATKFYTVKKEINGTEYVAQFSGISTALKAVDACYIEGTSNTSTEKLAQYLFENIIVEPKGLTADDFATMEEFNEVIGFARGVMQGNFRDKENEGAVKAASKK